MKALLSFIEISTFTTRVLESLSDEDYAKLQWLLGKCPTSFQLVEGLVSRPQPDASTSWKLVGHCAARFSFFQGAGHEGLLINHHDAGDLIASGGGIRKIRWGISRFSDHLPLVVELELRGAL